jgi:hypothetical protein
VPEIYKKSYRPESSKANHSEKLLKKTKNNFPYQERVSLKIKRADNSALGSSNERLKSVQEVF